jgi:hypothetical protein
VPTIPSRLAISRFLLLCATSQPLLTQSAWADCILRLSFLTCQERVDTFSLRLAP